MFWEILWALCLGFFISGVVQAVVSKRQVATILGDDRPRTIATAYGLGAASSSCSYAAVAIARALLRKVANFTAAIAFELGSTNPVAELGIIMAILLGWQFIWLSSWVHGHGCDHGGAVSHFPETGNGGESARAGEQRHCGPYGRPCRNGHGGD